MAFNHYAKLKSILDNEPQGWYIRRINEPTRAKTFSGVVKEYPHYYRLYDYHGNEIKYGKFQQLDRLAAVLGVEAATLPIVE